MDCSKKRPYDSLSQSYSSKRRRPVSKWWQRAVIYQVYPRSFYDCNGDGTGDIKGIIQKADYLSDIGIGAIWLSPVYTSPMADFGYDVSDFKNVDPIFGSLEDFDLLIKEMHSRDIRVLMDFIPNHTSDEHEWFLRSCEGEEPYDQYYIWQSAKGVDSQGYPIPPNNWLSVFGGSAWTWNEERQQFYLHQFLDKQPDLNFRNKDVVEEMEDILRFWLERGVDGFRVDSVKHLFEAEDFNQDEPLADNHRDYLPLQYEYLNHTLTVNRPEVFTLLKGWRQIMDQYLDRLLIVEVYDGDINMVMKYYGDQDQDQLAHFPFNFYLITDVTTRDQLTGISLKSIIDQWMDHLPEGKWPNWVLGNHDNGRVASRLGSDIVDALHMLIMLLPGTPITYYGEEIGMGNTKISYEETCDPYGLNFGPDRYQEFSRDPARTPMQWDTSRFGGFTKGSKTWLPVNSDYKEVNVEADEKARQSHLKVYKQLVKLRQEDAFTRGDLTFPIVTDKILSFFRCYGEYQRYMVVINTSTESTVVDIIKEAADCPYIPELAQVVVRSSEDSRLETQPGTQINTNNITLHSGGGLVLQMHKVYQYEDQGEK